MGVEVDRGGSSGAWGWLHGTQSRDVHLSLLSIYIILDVSRENMG
jgi:hypothetical protein